MDMALRLSLVFALLSAVAVAGFWPHYLSVAGSGFPRMTHLHALAMALWLVLLVAQPLLIRLRRARWHRRVGAAAWVLAPLVVATSLALAWRMTAPVAGATIEAFRYGLFFVQVSTALLFAVCVGAALAWRRDAELHARAMVAAGLTLVDPVLARGVANLALPAWAQVEWASAAMAVALAGVLAVADRRAARGRWVYAASAAALAAIAVVGSRIGDWPPWRALMESALR